MAAPNARPDEAGREASEREEKERELLCKLPEDTPDAERRADRDAK